MTNVYSRANIFYINRVTGERVDQLPFLPSIGLDEVLISPSGCGPAVGPLLRFRTAEHGGQFLDPTGLIEPEQVGANAAIVSDLDTFMWWSAPATWGRWEMVMT